MCVSGRASSSPREWRSRRSAISRVPASAAARSSGHLHASGPAREVGENAHIGNFVELKATIMGQGAKANHLAYLGDADIGSASNIGAGTIFVNYDGFGKYRTVIGAEAFIGSNSSLVAPLRIGRGANVAAGSVITEDVPADAVAFGRARQVTKKGRATRFVRN